MSLGIDADITRTLEAVSMGDRQAADELLPLVYDQLRNLAKARLAKESPGQTLQPTALVHEAYMRVVGSRDPGWEGRGHFFGAAARAMRQIMVEQARRKAGLKHGGGQKRIGLSGAQPELATPGDEVLAVDHALQDLEEHDLRAALIVNLRYFAGLTTSETAEALGVSVSTIEREWRYIKRWLYLQLQDSTDPSEST